VHAPRIEVAVDREGSRPGGPDRDLLRLVGLEGLLDPVGIESFPDTGRSRVLLTPAGRREAERAAVWPDYLIRAVEGLDPAEQAVLLRVLVNRNVSTSAHGSPGRGVLHSAQVRRAFDLLDDALDSLGAAQDLLATGRWAKACFMAQQAAELAAKAALNALGRERKGHDVHHLLEELGREVPEVLNFMEDAKILDQYYIPTRYMNAFAEGSARSHFTERQAKEAVSMAERVVRGMERIVHGRLPRRD